MALLNTAATSAATVPTAKADERDRDRASARPGAANQSARDGDDEDQARSAAIQGFFGPGRVGDGAERPATGAASTSPAAAVA